jgi:hypothetical protein
MLAKDLQSHRVHFEDVMKLMGMLLPCKDSVHDRLIEDDYDDID